MKLLISFVLNGYIYMSFVAGALATNRQYAILSLYACSGNGAILFTIASD